MIVRWKRQTGNPGRISWSRWHWIKHPRASRTACGSRVDERIEAKRRAGHGDMDCANCIDLKSRDALRQRPGVTIYCPCAEKHFR